MSFAGKVAVVFGATGYVGQGVVDQYLAAGATVVAIGRELKKLEELKTKVSHPTNLHLLAGDVTSEESVQKLHQDLKNLLNGKDYDHVISSVGFVYSPPGAVTQSSLKDLHGALDEGLPQNFLIAREFLPSLKNREGSTFTIVSGGFAYVCPEPHFWTGTLKNAALNALTLGLASETKSDKVRLNNICIGIGVAPINGEKNQFGWPAADSRKFGACFVALAKGTKKGEIVNIQKVEQLDELPAALAQ